MPTETFWLVLAAVALILALGIVQVHSKDQLARLERKLDSLLRLSGLELAGLADREAAALLRAGKKIEAIRAYRDLTGAGLVEAKARVEVLERAII
jgi:hypothetical protein